MKRLLSIARTHGARTLVSRAAGFARRTAAGRLRALSDRYSETRDAALSRRPFTGTFPKHGGPVVLSVLALGTSDPRELAALQRMLARELRAAPPSEVFTIAEPSDAAVQQQREAARGSYVYYVTADAVLRRGCIAALLETLERNPQAAACVSQLRSEGLDYVHAVESADFTSVLCRRGVDPRAPGQRILLQPRSRVDVRGGFTAAHAPYNRPVREHGEAILVVDDHVPFEDRDAGSERMTQILRLMRKRAHVIFASVDRRSYDAYGERLRQDGIELLCGLDDRAIRALGARSSAPISTVWLSRPDVAARFLLSARKSLPAARVLYDTVDLHFVRLQRQQAATGIENNWQRYESVELSIARASDATIVTSPAEVAILRERGIANVRLVSMAAESGATVRSAGESRGLVFFGNYAHSPNVDAAAWLARDILPAVRAALPDVTLTLAGSDPTLEVQRLASSSVSVTGYVPDLDTLIAGHRLAVLPLRFGAGIKGKVLRAMACGIPVITTGVGAEGIAGGGAPLALAETAEQFVAEIVRAYTDPARWEELARISLDGARLFSLSELAAQLGAALSRENA